MRNFAIIILFLASVFHPSRVHALIDPARAAAIDVASELEKKALNAQYKVQMLQSTGHIWTRQEVDAVTDFQKEFNDYVSTFNSLLTYAAEIYGPRSTASTMTSTVWPTLSNGLAGRLTTTLRMPLPSLCPRGRTIST